MRGPWGEKNNQFSHMIPIKQLIKATTIKTHALNKSGNCAVSVFSVGQETGDLTSLFLTLLREKKK